MSTAAAAQPGISRRGLPRGRPTSYLRRNQDEVLPELPDIIATDVHVEVSEGEHLASKQALAARNLNGARIALPTADGQRSARIIRLDEIIGECRAGQKKVLIFSQFRDVLRLCAAVIGAEALAVHGDVPISKRPGIVQKFEDTQGFGALVMQIDTGGIGLNLQAASVVILMEPQLKPSTEQQAIARAHRMQQTQTVVVYRLIAVASVDERIVQLSGFKAELFQQIARRSALAEAVAGRQRHLGARAKPRRLCPIGIHAYWVACSMRR